jgi:hypothetical protein
MFFYCRWCCKRLLRRNVEHSIETEVAFVKSVRDLIGFLMTLYVPPRFRIWTHAILFLCGITRDSLRNSTSICTNIVQAFSCRKWQFWNMRGPRIRTAASYFSPLFDTIERKLPLAIHYKLHKPPVAGAQRDWLQSNVIAYSHVFYLQGREL